MAKLRLPENCTACGVVLMEHDQVVFEREATLQNVSRGRYRRIDGVTKWVSVVTLEPRLKPTSPRNVRHKVCPDGQP